MAEAMARGVTRTGELSNALYHQQDLAGPRKDYRNEDFFQWSERAADLEDRAKELEQRLKNIYSFGQDNIAGQTGLTPAEMRIAQLETALLKIVHDHASQALRFAECHGQARDAFLSALTWAQDIARKALEVKDG